MAICSIVSFRLDGMSTDQELSLRNRKKWKTSQEEYWREIYMILFPASMPIPSPCKWYMEWLISSAPPNAPF
jgi:hypothetical protein